MLITFLNDFSYYFKFYSAFFKAASSCAKKSKGKSKIRGASIFKGVSQLVQIAINLKQNGNFDPDLCLRYFLDGVIPNRDRIFEVSVH
jgi:hypothetical protein